MINLYIFTVSLQQQLKCNLVLQHNRSPDAHVDLFPAKVFGQYSLMFGKCSAIAFSRDYSNCGRVKWVLKQLQNLEDRASP